MGDFGGGGGLLGVFGVGHLKFKVKGFKVKSFKVKGFKVKSFKVKGFKVKGIKVEGIKVKSRGACGTQGVLSLRGFKGPKAP